MKTNLLPQLRKSLLIVLTFSFLFSQNTNAQSCSVTGDSFVCENQVAYYSTSVSGVYSYTWNAYGGVVVGSGTAVSVQWQNAGTGSLTLVVRNQLNQVVCTSNFNVAINPSPKPDIIPSYTVGCGIINPKDDRPSDKRNEIECLKACDSTTITYSTKNNPGSTYNWIITGNANYTPSTSNSINVYWTGVGSGAVKVIETDSFGCVGEAEICVKIIDKPHALFTTHPSPINGEITVCKNSTIYFTNQSYSGAGTPIMSYEWIFGDGQTSTQFEPTYSYPNAGTYVVQLVVQNECRCKDTFSLIVNVDSTPGPEIFCVSTVCPGSTVTYNTNVNCSNFNWSASNGTITGDSTQSSVTVTWGNTGPGVITLNTPNCIGLCSNPTSIKVPIISPISQINGSTLICLGETVKYSISCNIPIDSILWHLPVGAELVSGDTVNGHEILVIFNTSFTNGSITVDYYHKIPGSIDGLDCGGSAELNISARPKMEIYGTTEICENDAVNFSVQPPVSGNIQWTISDPSGFPIYYANVYPSNIPFYLSNWVAGPGLFKVTANGTSGQYCNSPQTTVLKVNPEPPPPDSIKGLDQVCPNRPYAYIAFQTSSNFAIEWDIQNGTPTAMGGTAISVLWNSSGPYILNAYQVNPLTGCKSQVLTRTISSALPLTSFPIFGAATSCANTSLNYYVNVSGDNFEWSISPTIAGSVVSGQGTQNVGIEWNNYMGNATITVKRMVCGQSISVSKTIVLTTPPTPNINIPPVECAGVPVSVSSSTNASLFSWDFGDGGQASGANSSHTYSEAGNYIVTLTVTYSGTCNGSASTTGSIMINPKPNITISTPDPTVYCGPIGPVNLYVAAPVTGTVYTWYKAPNTLLGSGNSITVSTVGDYYVIGENSFGCTGKSNTIKIDSNCTKCTPKPNFSNDFTFSKQGCNTDDFNGTFAMGASNPRWDFDDPFSSSNFAFGSNVSHFFSEPGFYRVKFCVTVPSINNIDSCVLCKYKVDTIKYVPDFFDSMYCTSSGFNVKFINNTKRLSILPIPSYEWTITPGNYSSTAANPSFGLPAGTYSVTLKVNNICSLTKIITVPPMPKSLFSIADSVCQGTPVAFTNNSVGYTSSFWDFGDGASSTINDPNRTYSTPGVFGVTLAVSNDYGCADKSSKKVVVLPNTLKGVITPSDKTICEGDSVQYKVIAAGGYPPYQYLWSSIESTPDIWAKHTGSYYVDISDSKGCMFKTDAVNVMVNPVPKPEIVGSKNICINTISSFSVNYQATSGYGIKWLLLPENYTSSNTSTFMLNLGSQGNHILIVEVIGPTGCIGADTFYFTVHHKPVANITSTGSLCEGENNILIGSSSSTNISHTYWNNGWTNDTIIASVPDQYVYTVTNIYGCKTSVVRDIHPLPDFCGYQSGCYTVCDSIKELVWHAPKGYYKYQWYFNGNIIMGATNDTLHIPINQSGTYQVEIETIHGCVAMSEPTEITFEECLECLWNIEHTISCGEVSSNNGNQAYTVTMTVYNNFPGGATLNVIPSSGNVSGNMPVILQNTGLNTFGFIYTPSVQADMACFTLVQTFRGKRCDTTICIELPDCELVPCEQRVNFKDFDCTGIDSNGNPQYYACINVYWGGSNGSSLTINTPSGMVVPNTFVLNNGMQTLCFTYTDLPPYTNSSIFHFTFFDIIKKRSCKDELKIEHKPCKEVHHFETFNNCANCVKDDNGLVTYELNITLINPFQTNATATILPIASGTFGAIVPNPIPPGLQNIKILFTDDLPKDTFICFKVMLKDAKGNKSFTDICMYLPPCNNLSYGKIGEQSASLKLVPNPTNSNIVIYYNVTNGIKPHLVITDMTGRKLIEIQTENTNGAINVNLDELAAGTYLVKMFRENAVIKTDKLIIVR